VILAGGNRTITSDQKEIPMTDQTMLGRDVDLSEYGVLDVFPISGPMRIDFDTNELHALCPAVSGVQPDIYEATISYTAVTHAVESKSLKLWLVTFRDKRIFGEHLAVRVYDHLTALGPKVADVRVRLVQNVRGGIVTTICYPDEGTRT
jgi:7-cyano-7-deazaguanine reductase